MLYGRLAEPKPHLSSSTITNNEITSGSRGDKETTPALA